jgi:hypothetical protein
LVRVDFFHAFLKSKWKNHRAVNGIFLSGGKAQDLKPPPDFINFAARKNSIAKWCFTRWSPV